MEQVTKPLKTPDITPMQIIAIAGSVMGVCLAFGLPITHAQEEAVMNLIQVIAPFMLGSDAIIRLGRAIKNKGN